MSNVVKFGGGFIFLCIIFVLVASSLGIGRKKDVVFDFTRVERAGKMQVEFIKEGLGEKFKIQDSVAIPSKRHPGVYFVAVKATGNKRLVGVWAIRGGKEKCKSIFSVSSKAMDNTPFPHHCNSKSKYIMDNCARTVERFLLEKREVGAP